MSISVVPHLLQRPILGIRFGNFKGEETALLAVLENGSISVNILKRQSLNDLHKVKVNKDLFNFKRPAAYVECVKREKQHSKGRYSGARFC